jgi:hypothetical protein
MALTMFFDDADIDLVARVRIDDLPGADRAAVLYGHHRTPSPLFHSRTSLA